MKTTAHQRNEGKSPRSGRKRDHQLAAAIARGERLRRQMSLAEGGAITCAETACLLRISEAAVLKRWRDHRLIGWTKRTDTLFPVWQFKGRKLLAGVEAVLRIFRSDEHWRVMAYFLCERLSLQERRPLDLLRSGKVAEVIRHAKAYAREDLW
jgi:hypothetical protein